MRKRQGRGKRDHHKATAITPQATGSSRVSKPFQTALVRGLKIISAITLLIGLVDWLPATSNWLQRTFLHETEQRTGRLVAAGESTPPNACGSSGGDRQMVTIIAGTNAMTIQRSQSRSTVLALRGRPIVEFVANEDGFLDVYAKIYDSQGRKVADFSGGNEFSINQQFAKVSKSKSEIVLWEGGRVLFRVKYINDSTASIDGRFFSPDSKDMILVDGMEIKTNQSQMIFRRMCFEGNEINIGIGSDIGAR